MRLPRTRRSSRSALLGVCRLDPTGQDERDGGGSEQGRHIRLEWADLRACPPRATDRMTEEARPLEPRPVGRGGRAPSEVPRRGERRPKGRRNADHSQPHRPAASLDAGQQRWGAGTGLPERERRDGCPFRKPGSQSRDRVAEGQVGQKRRDRLRLGGRRSPRRRRPFARARGHRSRDGLRRWGAKLGREAGAHSPRLRAGGSPTASRGTANPSPAIDAARSPVALHHTSQPDPCPTAGPSGTSPG